MSCQPRVAAKRSTGCGRWGTGHLCVPFAAGGEYTLIYTPVSAGGSGLSQQTRVSCPGRGRGTPAGGDSPVLGAGEAAQGPGRARS